MLDARCRLVEITEDVKAQDEHGSAEGDQAGIFAQQRPIANEVTLEVSEVEFRKNEEQ